MDTKSIVFEYENSSIGNWQSDAEFVRPKWGIYRSLNDVNSLRDEAVLFADFSVEEVATLFIADLKVNKQNLKTFPNPAKYKIQIKGNVTDSFNQIYIYDVLVKQIERKQQKGDNTIDVSNLKSTSYYFIFKKDLQTVSKNTIIIK